MTPGSSPPPSTPRLVLASASPRRRELLAALGVPFTVRAADVPEELSLHAPAPVLAEELALAKASAVAREEPDALVLGADTIVVLDGRPLGKPASPEEARQMLRALRGRAHEVVTGVAVIARGGVTRTAHAVTRVVMRCYSDAEMEEYIASGDPFDKAGAYAIQHPGFQPVARVEGCYCNVVGLPLWTVRRLLAEAAPGLSVPRPDTAFPRCACCPLAASEAAER
jgi:septum formation protein